MNIRPFNFSDTDYQTLVDVTNAAHPEAPRTVKEIHYFDNTRGKGELLGRFMVETGNNIVGWIQYETPRNPTPGALELRYRLLPEYERLTQPLWDFIMIEMASVKPKSLVVREREDWHEAAFFLTQQFTEYDRMWASSLDVTTFSAGPLEHSLQRSREAGITFRTLSEFPHEDLEFREHWYDLLITLLHDVPSAEPIVPWAFETWLTRVPHNPTLLPKGYFFALAGEKFVGVSELWKSNRPQTLQTGLTAVKQNYRRKGVAQSLKLKATEFAKQSSVQFIRTNNHIINHPMLAINEAMGFVKEPAWVHLKKDLV
jgi:RimJ/RimL family protein N-acetyltransferase